MSPEAGKILNDLVTGIKKATGVLPTEEADSLDAEAKVAVSRGDYARVSQISPVLARHQIYADQIEAAATPLRDLILRLNLENLDIAFEELKETEEPTIEEPESPTAKAKRRDEKKYIDSAPTVIAMALVKKNNKGPVSSTVEDVYKTILQHGRSSKEDLRDAKTYYYVSVSKLSAVMLNGAEVTRATTIKDLVDSSLQKMKDPKWIEFYGYIRENYGELNPTKFVTDILQRFLSKKEKKDVKTEQDKAKAETDAKPSQIQPIHEIRLDAKITTPGVIKSIEQELLGGAGLEETVKKHGWKTNKSLVETISDAAAVMATLRKGAPSTPKDDKDAARFIQNVIFKLAVTRKGWHMIRDEYKGFKMLYSLMEALKDNPKAPIKLFEILYRGVSGTIDHQGMVSASFVPGENR